MKYACAFLACLASPAFAADPAVETATIAMSGSTATISVTIRHPDTGWDHFADGWAVLAPDGSQLGYRKLLHPHETEQPFTRSLSGITIPAGVDHVLIRAHCSVTGNASQTFRLNLR